MCVLPRLVNDYSSLLSMPVYDNLLPFYGLPCVPAPFYMQRLRPVARFVGPGHILELGDAAQDPAFGSAHVRGCCTFAHAAQSNEAQAGPGPVTVAAPGGLCLALMGFTLGWSHWQ